MICSNPYHDMDSNNLEAMSASNGLRGGCRHCRSCPVRNGAVVGSVGNSGPEVVPERVISERLADLSKTSLSQYGDALSRQSLEASRGGRGVAHERTLALPCGMNNIEWHAALNTWPDVSGD